MMQTIWSWLRTFTAISALLALAACVDTHEIQPDKPASFGPKEGAFIVGQSFANSTSIGLGLRAPLQGAYIAYDPITHLRKGTFTLPFFQTCKKTGGACEGGTEYRVYRVPAGDYALAWTYYRGMLNTYVRFEKISVTTSSQLHLALYKQDFSEKALVPPSAPIFHVDAGKVTYVGDFLVDVQNYGHITTIVKPGDESKARETVTMMDLADKLIVEPMGGPSQRGVATLQRSIVDSN